MSRTIRSRRQFLAGAALCAATRAIRLEAFPFAMPLGVQGFDIQSLEFKDMDATWKQLAGFGYQFIDFMSTTSGRGVPPNIAAMSGKQLRVSLGAAGLSAPNAFFTLAEFRDAYDKTLEYAKGLGVKNAVVTPIPPTATADDWKRVADELNRMGEKTARDGILLGYHNHAAEFRDLDSGAAAGSTTAWDIMISGTEAKNVQFQIDMGNLAQAGKDPLTYVTKYPDRYFSIHVKDIADGKLGLALGEGTLPIPKILAAAKACRSLQNYVVETGARGDVVMEKLRLSQIYLRDLKI